MRASISAFVAICLVAAGEGRGQPGEGLGQSVSGPERTDDGAARVDPADRGSMVLEEVVVTAGFRRTSLDALPGSATVLDADDLEAEAAEHLETVLELSPNVSYSSGGSRARFVQIRGVGDLEQFVDPKHYPSVGIALDDINLGGIASSALLFDAERVEVLRGPQGTRFGTSALAGLVNVRGRAPTREFEGYVSAGLGDYGTSAIGAAIGGPLADRVFARIAARNHRSDGFIRNDFLGADDTNGYDETSVRAAFRVEPASGAIYEFTLLDFESNNGYDAFSLDNRRHTLSDEPGFDRQDSTALSARGTWDVGAGSVEATLTLLDAETDYGFDEDWTFVGLCDGTLCDPVFDFFSNTDEYERNRQERTIDFRWLGDVEGPLGVEYVAGVFLQRRDEDLHRRYYGDFFSDYATDRQALYAQATLRPSVRAEIAGGLRIERFDDDYADSFGGATSTDDTLKTGELSVTFDVGPRSALYGSLSRGQKAGGINTEASANRPFMQPRFQTFLDSRLRITTETLTSLEVGLKGRYLDDRLSVRAALFDMDRSAAQLESWIWDSVGFLWVGLLDNVDGRNRGIELEADALIGSRWALSIAVGLLDASVDNITTFDLDRDEFVESSNVDQAKSPDWQVSAAADWRPAGPWSARLELRARDASRFGYYHDGRLGSSATLNGAVSRRFGAATVRVYGRNLTDRNVAVHGLYFGNDPRKGWVNETYLQYAEPRMIGVEFDYVF